MVSSGGVGSCHVCPELEQITLLIDVGTECQDVPQAHLSFERREAEGESHMPSLRKLVKPTDWPKLSASVRTLLSRSNRRPCSEDLVLSLTREEASQRPSLDELRRHPALEHLKLPKSGSKEVLCLNETAALGAGGT
eukprot:g27511.t1